MKTLTKNEYIWAVFHIDNNDGRSIIMAYFSDQGKAEAYKQRHKLSKVGQISLYQDENGKYYEVPYHFTEVLVDAPEKHEILAKLTDIEKKVLGLK